ncbi:MAG TPA: SAV_6107 family HEPN domain-containing protein, partial [Segeticoccus sp.]|nr:SAV_6107 family HEPN domain-containing protein [Segeticoccus sp.]
LDRSRASLLAACCSSSADERYVDAHLGALRAAAALLAARRVPGPRSRPRSVWALLPTVATELAEWATFFEASARRRAAIERGAAPAACREADDLLRQAEVFHELVQAALGLPMAEPLPDFVAPTSPGASR